MGFFKSVLIPILLEPQSLQSSVTDPCSPDCNRMDKSGYLILSGEKLTLKLEEANQFGLVPVLE